MALKQIKNKIIATQKTGKVTKAMEAVSAVKMRKSQLKAFEGRPYVHSAMRILSRLSKSKEGLAHPFARKRETAQKVLLVIVTSDKGLAGSVNSAVLKKAEVFFAQHKEVAIIAIGRKSLEFAERSKKEIIASYTNVKDDVTLSDVTAVEEIIMETFTDASYASVSVLYQNLIPYFSIIRLLTNQ